MRYILSLLIFVGIAFGQNSVTFNYQIGGSVPAASLWSITSGSNVQVAVTVTTSGQSWLLASLSSTETPAVLTISVNPTGLTVGTYVGIVEVTSGNRLDFQVTLTVTPAAPALSVSSSAFTFNAVEGGPSPASQTLVVGASTPGVSVFQDFTTSLPSWLMLGNWIGVGTSPTTITVAANPSGLTPGTYSASVTFYTIPSSGIPSGQVIVNVTLVVTAPALTISVSPRLLNFAYLNGGNLPLAQAVTVSGTSGAAFTAAASGSSWLSVTPTSGTTPASLSVSVNPAGLNPGTYNGTITVTGTNGTQGTSVVNVTLTVAAPLPTISAVTNAASYANGSVSPGELVTLFGTAIGPATAASATTDPTTGKLVVCGKQINDYPAQPGRA